MYFKTFDFEIEKADAIAPLVGAALISGAATALNGGLSYLNNLYNRDLNEKNLDFAREQFEYQKHLNQNQYQIAAADMEKAGINPAMAAGGVNLSSGSYSSGTSNTVAPQIDISPLISLAQTKMTNETQKQVADTQAESNQKVAETQAESNQKIALLQSQTQQNMLVQRLTQEDRQFQAKLAQDMSIENIKAELTRRGIESNESIEAAKRVSEQLKRNDDFLYAQEQIRLEEKKIENAKTAAEKDAAVRAANGWKSFAASIFHTIVNGAISVFTGTSTPGTSNPIGFSAN